MRKPAHGEMVKLIKWVAIEWSWRETEIPDIGQNFQNDVFVGGERRPYGTVVKEVGKLKCETNKQNIKIFKVHSRGFSEKKRTRQVKYTWFDK